MFFLKSLDICFRFLLYESIFIPKSLQIPPLFLEGGFNTFLNAVCIIRVIYVIDTKKLRTHQESHIYGYA